ncbi:MAG: hypothetical protein LBT49_06725 [Prevotellaceae bacterium]|jgi:hypothetical protein|nr:hypothetical protein [Prevotellaceae bacterium]
MEAEDKISQLEQLIAGVTAYINLRLDALKLQAAGHLSSFSGWLLGIITGALLLLLALLFFLAGFAYWLGQLLDSPAAALCLTGGLIVCVTGVVLLLRKCIFTNRMVRYFVKMFFNHTPQGFGEKPDGAKADNDEA